MVIIYPIYSEVDVKALTALGATTAIFFTEPKATVEKYVNTAATARRAQE